MRPALITAGSTRNPVDATRYLAADSSGATGVGLAGALRNRFATLLLGSEEALLRARLADPTLAAESFGSTRDLMARMEAHIRANPAGVVVHAAAVGDYECAAVATKIPSGQPELLLRLTPAPKILDRIRVWDPDCFLTSFKAGSPEWSDERLEAVARAQLSRTTSDLVFANRLGDLGRGCLLLDARGTERFERREDALAALLARITAT